MNKATAIALLPERFVSKINFDGPGGCWLWTAATFERGYGAFGVHGKMRRAHRVSYGTLVAEIPAGALVDHMCFEHACVNPDHLRLVTNKQNGEHRSGAQSNSKSGIRGVIWEPRKRRWAAIAYHHGRRYFGGYHAELADAEVAAVALRARLFTHDDGYQA